MDASERIFDFFSGIEVPHDGVWIKGKYPASCGIIDAWYNPTLNRAAVRDTRHNKTWLYDEYSTRNFIKP